MKFEPLYLRVQERLREDLGGSAKRERLPTLDELQSLYQVSRPTLSKALAALAAEGFLRKQPGRGGFALASPLPEPAPASRLTIGFIAPLAEAELPQKAFRGIDRVAHRRDCRVLMAGAGDSVAREQTAAREMIAAGARGLIIYPALRQGGSQAQDYLGHEDLGVPIVLVDTCTPAQGRAQVIFDNRRAGFQMTQWLLDRGHRRIALLFYSEEVHHPGIEARCQGYQEALQDHGLPFDASLARRIPPTNMETHLEPALEDLLALPAPPTALLACDDIMAMDVIERLFQRGISVPASMLVTGFDNRVAARRFHPAFMTTQPDFDVLGEVACRMLLDGIEAGALPTQTYILPVPLLTRHHVHRPLIRSEAASASNGLLSPVSAHAVT